MSVAESQVATLKDGDYFGKNALLRGEPRTATIKAKTDLSTFKITRTKFEELGLREKLDFPPAQGCGWRRCQRASGEATEPKDARGAETDARGPDEQCESAKLRTARWAKDGLAY